MEGEVEERGVLVEGGHKGRLCSDFRFRTGGCFVHVRSPDWGVRLCRSDRGKTVTPAVWTHTSLQILEISFELLQMFYSYIIHADVWMDHLGLYFGRGKHFQTFYTPLSKQTEPRVIMGKLTRSPNSPRSPVGPGRPGSPKPPLTPCSTQNTQ